MRFHSRSLTTCSDCLTTSSDGGLSWLATRCCHARPHRERFSILAALVATSLGAPATVTTGTEARTFARKILFYQPHSPRPRREGGGKPVEDVRQGGRESRVHLTRYCPSPRLHTYMPFNLIIMIIMIRMIRMIIMIMIWNNLDLLYFYFTFTLL